MSMVPTRRQGWLLVAALALFMAVGQAAKLYQQRRSLVALASPQPRQITTVPPTEEEVRIVERKLADVAAAIRQGEPRTVAFTAAQLNALVATQPELAPLRGRLLVRLPGNEIELEGSVPFALLEVPFMGQRYLAGTVTVRPAMVKDKLHLEIVSARLRQGQLPADLRTVILRRDWLAKLRLAKDPARRRAFQQFEGALADFTVRDGLLLVRTRDRQAAPPAPGGDAAPPTL